VSEIFDYRRCFERLVIDFVPWVH